MKEIRFLSNNEYKIDEFRKILKNYGIKVIPINLKIKELQTLDMTEIVKDKLLKAFQIIGKPVIVEQTGLYIDFLNGFPGGLTQIFWDKLQADKFASMINNFPVISLTAKTVIGYCDLIKLHFFEGEIKGNVPKVPTGDRHFQWDCVFIPDGYTETFAEMGSKKNDISMRKIAIENLCDHLKRG
jgi:XTP/dITP diphosphohydrolase